MNRQVVVLDKGIVTEVPIESIEMSIAPSETGDAVLHQHPVLVLAAMCNSQCRFSLVGANVQLHVPLGDRPDLIYRVALQDSKRIHYYRRLLAQTALTALGTEYVCARLIDRAIAAGRLSKRTLAAGFFDDKVLPCQLALVEHTVSSEAFVRSVTGDRLARLLSQKLESMGHRICFGIEYLPDKRLWTVIATIDDKLFETGIYAHSGVLACDIAMLHFLTDTLVPPPKMTID